MKDKFISTLLETKEFKNSLYVILKHSFLYHSNKIEGSKFTTEALALLLDKNVVTGNYKPLENYIDGLEDFRVEYKFLWEF